MAALIVAAAVRPAAAEPAPLSGASRLAPFFAALSGLDRHRATAPVRIIQIGDSHTANDAFSGRLRARLQQRFGDAGRGWLPAGIPYRYYAPDGVVVGAEGWRPVGLKRARLPLGLDAVAAESTTAGAAMTLADSDPAGFDRVALEFLARPDSPPLALRIDTGLPLPVVTAAPAPRIRRVSIAAPEGSRRLRLTVQDTRPAILLGWAVERRAPGIVYENHGTIGATAALLDRIDPATTAFELRTRHPALIVVAFGTNEGFDDALDPIAYARKFAAAVARLKREAPGAAILVLGPPDGERVAAGCPKMPAATRRCSPRPANELRPDDACRWHAPRHLDVVREAQRRVAAAQGWAFWDWAAAMGGACSMQRMFTRDPPLAMPDHVHFATAGYRAMADVLYSDLLGAYGRWQSAHAPPHRSRPP